MAWVAVSPVAMAVRPAITPKGATPGIIGATASAPAANVFRLLGMWSKVDRLASAAGQSGFEIAAIVRARDLEEHPGAGRWLSLPGMLIYADCQRIRVPKGG